MQSAIAMPAMLMLVAGLADIGSGFRDVVNVSRATHKGAEIALLAPDDPQGDCLVIEGIAPMLADQISQVDRIEIQRTGEATTYSFDSGDPTDCQAWTASVAESAETNDSVNTVAVRVRVEHAWSEYPPFTGSYTIDKTATTRISVE